jgi:FkbM family methyltransferase
MNAVFNNPKLMSKVRGVIEVGASIGEEIPEWEKFKIPKQIFIEPLAELFEILENRSKQQIHKPDVKCFNIALSNFDGESDFHLSTGSTCSSSLLDFSKEAIKYGLTLQTSEVRKVKVSKLDSLIELEKISLPDYNLLFIDVQGNEFNLIKGAKKSLSSFDFIFCEVNFISLYNDSVLWKNFQPFMSENGFKLINLRNLMGSQGAQGEALFFRKDLKW